VKVMSGLLLLPEKSAERRCVPRWVFLVSMDAAATVTAPSAQTVPFPPDFAEDAVHRNQARMGLLFSRMLDLRGSRIHSPASVPFFSGACSGGAVICPNGACMIVSLSHRTDRGYMGRAPE
jgi:hypothetical protein